VYVLQVADRKPAGPASFEEVKQRLTADLQREIVMNTCKDTAQAIYADIEKGMDPKKAAKLHGEEYQTPDAFNRSGYVEGIRSDPMAIGAAFGLTTKGEISKPVPHSQGVVIFQLIERTTPDMSEYTAKHDSVYNVVLMNKRQDLFNRWMTWQATHADIQNYVQQALEEQNRQAQMP